MLFNIILGFILSWLFGLILIKKNSVIVLLISPIAAVIATTINTFGFIMSFWDFTPLIKGDESISTLPFDLGFYPVVASYLVYWIIQSGQRLLPLVIIILGTTLFEYTLLLFGKVSYDNGWNIFWTLCSYLLAFTLVYLYAECLFRRNLLIGKKQV